MLLLFQARLFLEHACLQNLPTVLPLAVKKVRMKIKMNDWPHDRHCFRFLVSNRLPRYTRTISSSFNIISHCYLYTMTLDILLDFNLIKYFKTLQSNSLTVIIFGEETGFDSSIGVKVLPCIYPNDDPNETALLCNRPDGRSGTIYFTMQL